MPTPSNQLPAWQHAHGGPLSTGRIRQTPDDFQVVEELGFTLSGDGEHDFLLIEKVGTNTSWVARALARHAGVAERDVGYAGRKDRHARTRQWFSVRRPDANGTDWAGFDIDNVKLVERHRHQRKLKRGAHRGNQFQIAIRDICVADDSIDRRLLDMRSLGVPNYFGPQRFGHNASNLQLAREIFAGKRVSRERRSMALSAVRSCIFNEVLGRRVTQQSWNKPLPGDSLNLDGSGSVFVPPEIDSDIVRRASEFDLHPTGPLWGDGELPGYGDPAEMELSVANSFPDFIAGLSQARLKMARRPLRFVVRDFSWETREDALWLSFRLDRGSFATSVLRELISDV